MHTYYGLPLCVIYARHRTLINYAQLKHTFLLTHTHVKHGKRARQRWPVHTIFGIQNAAHLPHAEGEVCMSVGGGGVKLIVRLANFVETDRSDKPNRPGNGGILACRIFQTFLFLWQFFF